MEGYEQSLSFIIKEEKAYARKSAMGDLGVRVQNSGTGDPTAKAAIDKEVSAFIREETAMSYRRVREENIKYRDNDGHLCRGYSDGAKMYSMGMTKFQEVAKDAKACICKDTFDATNKLFDDYYASKEN